MQFEYDPEKLIKEVKIRPGIWDFEHADYKAKNLRHKLWHEVVKELMDSNVKLTKSETRELEVQLQKKWKSMRDCFQKYISNPNRTRRPYIYAKNLQFLLKNKDILPSDTDGASGGSEMDQKLSTLWKSRRTVKLSRSQPSSEDDDHDFDADQTANDNGDMLDISGPSKDQKINKNPIDEFVFANVDAPSRNENDDPDKLFLLSLLPHLRSIPETFRLNVKMELMQVLQNANFNTNGDHKML